MPLVECLLSRRRETADAAELGRGCITNFLIYRSPFSTEGLQPWGGRTFCTFFSVLLLVAPVFCVINHHHGSAELILRRKQAGNKRKTTYHIIFFLPPPFEAFRGKVALIMFFLAFFSLSFRSLSGKSLIKQEDDVQGMLYGCGLALNTNRKSQWLLLGLMLPIS